MRKSKTPDCHPDRKYYAKGLCAACYSGKRYHAPERSALRSRHATPRKPRPQATCHPNKKHLALGLCGPCYQKSHYLKHKERYNKIANEAYKRRGRFSAYGLTEESFMEMLERQEWKCAIAVCRKEFTSTSDAHIDHDHNTGHVRDLLCQSCNTGLGVLESNLLRACHFVTYLQKHYARQRS